MPADVAKAHQAIMLDEQFAQSLNVGHGRIERRYLTVTSDLNDYLDSPHVQQVFRSQRLIQHQTTGQHIRTDISPCCSELVLVKR